MRRANNYGYARLGSGQAKEEGKTVKLPRESDARWVRAEFPFHGDRRDSGYRLRFESLESEGASDFFRFCTACRRMNSIWPFTLRSSSAAHASKSDQSVGSIRRRNDFRSSADMAPW